MYKLCNLLKQSLYTLTVFLSRGNEMTSGRDLRDQMNSDAVADAFSFLISGKRGYKTVIERKVEPIRCTGCSIILKDDIKFCSECGTKVVLPVKK